MCELCISVPWVPDSNFDLFFNRFPPECYSGTSPDGATKRSIQRGSDVWQMQDHLMQLYLWSWGQMVCPCCSPLSLPDTQCMLELCLYAAESKQGFWGWVLEAVQHSFLTVIQNCAALFSLWALKSWKNIPVLSYSVLCLEFSLEAANMKGSTCYSKGPQKIKWNVLMDSSLLIYSSEGNCKLIGNQELMTRFQITARIHIRDLS